MPIAFRKIGAIFFVTMSTGIGWSHPLVDNDDLESNLILASLYRLTHFIKWPSSSDNSINLCADGSFADKLRYLAGKPSEQRQIKVLKKPVDISKCQIYFINNNTLTINAPDNLPLLTVSPHQGFIKNGGILEMRLTGERMRFYLDYTQAKNRSIQISSKLLLLMKIVK